MLTIFVNVDRMPILGIVQKISEINHYFLRARGLKSVAKIDFVPWQTPRVRAY
jgi:hypothetical protein